MSAPAKDNLAREFGATDFVDASSGDAVKMVLEMTKGGVDHSFEAVGLRRPPNRPSAWSSAAATPTSSA